MVGLDVNANAIVQPFTARADSSREIGLFLFGEFSDLRGMSQEPLVTEEVMARQTPEAQAIIRLLLARIAQLEARVAELEARLNEDPRNSSLPPGAVHPHAKPVPPKK